MFLHVSVFTWASISRAGTSQPPGKVHLHPSGQVHPQAGTPPRAGTPSQAGTPPQAGTPSPPQCMLGYGQQVGGTHPTEMHSCDYKISLFLLDWLCQHDIYINIDSNAK